MITAFTVRNFKAIGDEPVRIEFKPITLLFGANSVGKSSILHALNYAYSLFNDRNLSDSNYNLGGFERFVHGNDLKRSVVLRFELDFKAEDDIPYYCLNDFSYFGGYVEEPYDSLPMLRPNEILAESNNAYVEVEISWSYDQNRPYVSNYSTGFNGEWIASIHSEGYKKKNYICGFNIVHPVFNNLWINNGILMDWLLMTCVKSDKFNNYENKKNEHKNKFEKLINRHRVFKKLGRVPADCSLSNKLILDLHQHDALPNFLFLSSSKNKLLFGEIWRDPEYFNPYQHDKMHLGFKVGCPYYPVTDRYSLDVYLPKERWTTVAALTAILEDFLNSVLVAPGLKVTDWLNSICYLGPLREIPPRYFTGEYRKSKRWRWATGLAAWDALYWIGQQLAESAKSAVDIADQKPNLRELAIKLRDTINDWLASNRRLNTGYEVLIERYREISSELYTAFDEGKSQANIPELIKKILSQPEKIQIWLHDKSRDLKLTPHEIGTGISQVLPVVVAAVVDNELVAIEQPELHIHPALQVQLGDLFITQSSDSKFFLIETHSEHLLLRILRRINETYENRLPPDMKPCTPDDVAIYYLEKESQGLRIRRLEISEDGDSKGDWPEGFFEERRAELF